MEHDEAPAAVTGHPPAVMKAVTSPSTPDDQSRTWDGRVLNTKEKVLGFLAEIEESRLTGSCSIRMTTQSWAAGERQRGGAGDLADPSFRVLVERVEAEQAAWEAENGL